MLEDYTHSLVSQSEKDSKEEILKAFKLFDDDETVCLNLLQIAHVSSYTTCEIKRSNIQSSRNSLPC